MSSEVPLTWGKLRLFWEHLKGPPNLRRSEIYKESHPEGSTHFHSLTELLMLLGSSHCANDWEIAVG